MTGRVGLHDNHAETDLQIISLQLPAELGPDLRHEMPLPGGIGRGIPDPGQLRCNSSPKQGKETNLVDTQLVAFAELKDG